MILENVSSKTEKKYPSILVLWGEKFHEWMVTNVVIRLRQKGVRVKIVGIQGSTASGINGLTIEADLPLGQAQRWFNDATHVVIPCDKAELKRLEYDPRLKEYLANAANHGSQVVLGVANQLDTRSLELIQLFGEKVAFCSTDEEIGAFVNSLTASAMYA